MACFATLPLVPLILPLTQAEAARKWRLSTDTAAAEAHLGRPIASIAQLADVEEGVTFREILAQGHADYRLLFF